MTDKPLILVTRTQTTREDVIGILNDWLRMAKDGDLESIAICGVRNDGRLSHIESYTKNRATLLGAVTLMKHCITEALQHSK